MLIATVRERKGEVFTGPGEALPVDASLREQMAHRLRQPAGHAGYARRKAIVEPVFGQMKTRQHAGQLRLRGLAGAKGEWLLHAICHNLRKLRVHTDWQTGNPMIAGD
ncbi:transposase [Acidipropionibacterium thoenii]|uniref:transposase n=1 Tax=Acidipropionibacterium thoenii TaxID=1751 RepID=UPI000414A5D0